MEEKKENMQMTFEPDSCSCMTLTSETGKHYWFRTCDIETDLWADGAHVVQQGAGAGLEYCDGKKEVSNYSFIGMTYNQLDTWLLDGVNEQGLAGGLLMLYEGTGVDKPREGKQGYVGMELVTKMLSGCKDVEEVECMAKQVQILNIPYGNQSVPATMHYFFVDRKGREVILEAADPENPGILRQYKKEEMIGVMTNSPVYEKQLQNLSWYLSQSPEMRQGLGGQAITELDFEGRRVAADEKAWHVTRNGIFPASYSSYDRFIRVAVIKALNHSGHGFSDEKMLALGSNLMNAVNEPRNQGLFHYTRIEEDGTITGQKDSLSQYLIMYDIEAKCFYIKVFDMVSWIRYQLKPSKNGKKEIFDIVHAPMEGILCGNPS